MRHGKGNSDELVGDGREAERLSGQCQVGKQCICTVSWAVCPGKSYCKQVLRLEWFTTIKNKYYSALISRGMRLLESSIGPSCSTVTLSLVLYASNSIGAMNPVGITAIRGTRRECPSPSACQVLH